MSWHRAGMFKKQVNNESTCLKTKTNKKTLSMRHGLKRSKSKNMKEGKGQGQESKMADEFP